MLAEFDFEVVHRPGKSNVVADALSKLNAVQCGVASGGHHKEDLFKGLEQAYKNDKETKMIMQNLDVHREFCVIQNKLYYTGVMRVPTARTLCRSTPSRNKQFLHSFALALNSETLETDERLTINRST